MTAAAAIVNGWIEVTYTGPESALVEISVEPDVWVPAYLDYGIDGRRVAQIRPPAAVRQQTVQVLVRVDGSPSLPLGWLALP